ncbi:nitrate reductase molybdenum cofactor assembly chaperone [Streptomyces sp. 891-h]|uniref:nitrate reductase molybdenum cofactor assembly chaperone n=1 Tax=Streptomyces sp. 891-h TaxID=2720714 RepID=UPI001FAB0AED|nr:nitrate reductase molybdenum cofactor assembly chaperone [Streptomyces sp. 891-h]UNZ21203.1 nitrate reductase molybdenum cofactor assembly chaperone [Streptomyces sp. 891-h]
MSPLPATVPAAVRTRVRAALSPRGRTPRPARRGRPSPLTPEETEARALLLRLMSLLTQYPDAELTDARPVIAATVRALAPSPAASELAAFTGWLAEQEPAAVEQHYVEMFDLRRRSSLYLTYYLHGDTRRRGMALLTLAQRYRAAGWDTDGGELPDHLPLVLEFAALAGPRAGEAPLRQHRRGLELIHRALTDAESPYRHVLAALLSLLPPATEADLRAVAELAAQGPPNEDVGLDPYGAGEFAPPGTFVPPEQAPPTLATPPAARRQEDCR